MAQMQFEKYMIFGKMAKVQGTWGPTKNVSRGETTCLQNYRRNEEFHSDLDRQIKFNGQIHVSVYRTSLQLQINNYFESKKFVVRF